MNFYVKEKVEYVGIFSGYDFVRAFCDMPRLRKL